ncbi:hypothetical protein [Streptomyces sp. H27-C3]|uniref:hypothetical protein n=1 Tax=Streptomyces sp. H27-C3 TaxID=3046305 RepID=UPI0024BA29EB|nr:hypothetical protein [Streptomyces sp. H27-C3]MDJ0464591.1 hypothetical protein [Streptomyces sp. H27-C3]
MSRRLLLPLRTWSGVLLVCALFACLSGLARPAMAMPGPMEMTPRVAVAAHSGHAVTPAVAGTKDHGPRCPMAAEQCVAPKATLAQDGPAGPVLAPVPHAMACGHALLMEQPNAPPRIVDPPDLHRLCVSRT